MPNARFALAWLSLALGTACSTTAAPVAVVMPLGTRQCETGGRSAGELARTLREAGLSVLSEGCGHDGRMRPAMCGLPDGRIAIVEIPQDQLARAQALGWQPLSSVPDARREPCPSR